MQYLLLSLYGPLSSFGGIAIGIRRGSWPIPSKSAVLGMVAAAMGIERTREEEHLVIQESLSFAVRTDAPGRMLMDYHTVQVPPRRRNTSFATRKEELAYADLDATISQREWLCDGFFTVALWNTGEAAERYGVAAIARAFESPAFVVFLGRKSAPPALPFRPEIREAGTLQEAFSARTHTNIEQGVLDGILPRGGFEATVAVDGDVGDVEGAVRIERRRDTIVSRARWQFADRDEAISGG